MVDTITIREILLVVEFPTAVVGPNYTAHESAIRGRDYYHWHVVSCYCFIVLVIRCVCWMLVGRG